MFAQAMNHLDRAAMLFVVVLAAMPILSIAARAKYARVRDTPGIVEQHEPESASQHDERFVLAWLQMAVRPDVGIRLDGVQKPLCRMRRGVVKIEVLPPPRIGARCLGQFFKRLASEENRTIAQCALVHM